MYTETSENTKCVGRFSESSLSKNLLHIVSFILLAAVAAYVIMLVYTTRYVQYSADDFSEMNYCRSLFELDSPLSYFAAAIQQTADRYMSWQGTWSAYIFTYLLCALSQTGLKAVQFSLACIILLCFLSFGYLVYEITVRMKRSREIRLAWSALLLAAFIWAGMNTTSPSQVYYWMIGSYHYSINFACGVLGTGMYLRHWRKGTAVSLAAAAVLGLLTAGGPLTMAATFNAVYLAIVLIQWRETKDIPWKFGIPFFSIFASALLNTCAPGNYIRRGSTSFDIVKILGYTMGTTLDRYRLLLSSYLIGVCVLLFALALICGKDMLPTKWNPIWAWLYSFFIVYITIFPFNLGYDSNTYTPSRATYGWDLPAAVLSVLCSIYTACWLRDHLLPNLKVQHRRAAALVGAAALILNFAVVGLDSSCIAAQAHELADGSIKAQYEQQTWIYDTIQASEENDVVVSVPALLSTGTLKDTSLRTDSTYWVNEAAAEYYGKTSVSLTVGQ